MSCLGHREAGGHYSSAPEPHAWSLQKALSPGKKCTQKQAYINITDTTIFDSFLGKWLKQNTVKRLRVRNLCNKLFEFSDRLVQVRPNADGRRDGLALQINNMNLHHHLCEQKKNHKHTHADKQQLSCLIHTLTPVTGVYLFLIITVCLFRLWQLSFYHPENSTMYNKQSTVEDYRPPGL